MDDLRKTSLVGRKLAHYRISTVIGAGGMGEVYRATDTKLGRDVALKVLPSDMAADPDRLARFQREARAVAALNHPNVVTVYSVEEADDVHFITMELIEGHALDRLISTDGLPVDRVIEIANALADALAAAHEKGILHRDLKPANVMVTSEGRVKVLDFGLAKDVSAESSTDATLTSAGHTQAGIVMGTPAYMSPEQVSGRTLDHRTDIFSLGVMLYEMTTGRRPFVGTSSAELVSSILRDSPASVTEVRPDLPSDISRVIRRCLEKDPRHRVQTARDVSNEFRDLARTTTRLTPALSSAARTAPIGPGQTNAVLRQDEGFWVAVLPFRHTGASVDLKALAEGLSEEIITGLSRFSYLRVIARGSTAKYSSESGDIRAIGKELGARYVMEGSLRQAGLTIRVAVQLVDAATGTHLWAETFERPFHADQIFTLQDQLVPRIVSTVADAHGILTRSISAAVRKKSDDQLSPYEAVFRAFSLHEQLTAHDHAACRDLLERIVRDSPDAAECWAMLATLYGDEDWLGLNPLPNSLEREAAAARRAVELAPGSQIANHALAQSLFQRHEWQAFRPVAERTIALNPLSGSCVAFMGGLLACTGEWERGCALADSAMKLRPNFAGYYWLAPVLNAYRTRDYRAAIDTALRIQMPGFLWAPIVLAAAHGQLGEREEAQKALRELWAMIPHFGRQQLEKWLDPELVEHFMDGLRKAGLETMTVAARPPSSGGKTGVTPSGEARVNEGFWVAVLPFKYTGDNHDLKVLAEGLTEEIITGLSRFSYLHVIARGSTAKYSSESGDIRSIGKELGARYVMEGNLRQAGNKLRVAVQLVDAGSGAQMWAETYERVFSAEALFEVQDELVLRIVSTVADQHGVLPHSISSLIRNKPDDQLSPYEAVLRVFSFHERMSPEEHAGVRALLERAVQHAPSDGDCWAMLATLYADEYMFGFSGEPDPLGRAQKAAQRAVELAPSSSLAYQALAQSLFFRREWQAFLPVAERTVALNRADGALHAFIGMLIALAGDWDRGCAVVDAAIQLNPHHPGWYWLTSVFNTYRKRDYRASAGAALRINMPGYFWGPATSAAALGQLGEQAQKALKELLVIRPDFARTARQEFGKWFDDELAEHYVEGLRKAGLHIVDNADAAAAGKASDASAVRAEEGFWVAVLPFREPSGDTALESLGDGLTEDITTGLSRFPYLQVIARNSAMTYKGRAVDIRSVGRELGARYVMEGSIRRRGSSVRVSVQLMDAASGTQLWTEVYDREVSGEGTFQIQDDLTDHIVTSVADGYGVLVRSMAAPTRDRKVEELTASELVLRQYAFMQQIHIEEHALLRTGLEKVLEREPNHANGWASLANLYLLEYCDEFNELPDSLERSREATWRAIKIDPTCQMAWRVLAAVHFFAHDFSAFRETGERAISLNPRDGTTQAFIGTMLAFAGDWQSGVAMLQRAMDLSRHHPGWYHNTSFHYHYRKGEYERALQAAKKINSPDYNWMYVAIAAACGMLGRQQEAAAAIVSLRRCAPEFLELGKIRKVIEKWDPEKDEVERLMVGLQKAGLRYGADSGVTQVESSVSGNLRVDRTPSGASHAVEGFWVAVLPFKYTGDNRDFKVLAEGLTEEVITGLSRFSYLRVIARGSTAKYSSEAGDVRTIGKELGARYVMEASLRQAGSKLRLAVQLADTVSGAHLWAETYEREFSPEAIFDLQDDLVPRIVATVADQHGVLPHSMSEVLRQRDNANFTPHEAVLRAFGYFERLTPDEHAEVRQILEKAVAEAPGQSDCSAMLSNLYWHEYALGLDPLPDSLSRAYAAARRAVDAAPSNYLGHHVLAACLFFQKDILGFRRESERCLELNPLDSSTTAFQGILLAYSGDWERGCALVERASQLNPNHAGWYHFAPFLNAYRKGDYTTALKFAIKIDLPGYQLTFAARAAVFGQLGEIEHAQEQVRQLLALRPDAAVSVRQELGKWYQPDVIEHWLDGLRKAGLEIPQTQKQISSGPISMPPSIAILPFANMSDDKEQDYFSDGLAEEIINLMAQIPTLKVIARTSAFAFRGKEQDIRGIAETLGVRTILEGSVRRSGNRIRVTAQLINAADGSHLWSERYDRELSDIFAVQDEISAAIAKALRIKLSAEGAPQRYMPKLAAYDAYLKGRQQQGKVTPESLELARCYYEQAIEFDPAFGMAHIGLAFYWMTVAHFGQDSIHEAVAAARAEVQRALQIDPSLADGHALLGYLAALFDSDWASAAKHFEFPLAKQASFELVKPMYGGFLYLRGNADQAIKLAERAIEEDPLDVWAHMNLHAYLQPAGREDEALAQLQKVVELDPNQVVALASMVMIHADKGNTAEALNIARRAYAVGRWFPDTVGLLAALLRRDGKEEESTSIAKELGSGEVLGHARAHALFHLICGEIEQAADWVQKAIEQRDSSMRFYLGFVICRGLRASHHWPKIAKMVNLPA